MAQTGHEPRRLQPAEGGELGDVDHDGVAGLAGHDEGDDTVVTRRGFLAHTRGAIDVQ